MSSWRKFLLIGVGFGTTFAIVAAAIVGSWFWYQSRPKPWIAKAIVATFDYPDTESGPEEKNGFRPDQLVLYYTLENMTDFDYRLPPRDQIELNAKLKRENSLSANDQLLTLDDPPIFLPARQRIRIGIHLAYTVTKDFGPQDTKESQRKRWKAIADYMNNEVANLDGFVIFDPQNRYQINLPNGWKNIDLK